MSTAVGILASLGRLGLLALALLHIGGATLVGELHPADPAGERAGQEAPSPHDDLECSACQILSVYAAADYLEPAAAGLAVALALHSAPAARPLPEPELLLNARAPPR
jgi:hypothetical protein